MNTIILKIFIFILGATNLYLLFGVLNIYSFIDHLYFDFLEITINNWIFPFLEITINNWIFPFSLVFLSLFCLIINILILFLLIKFSKELRNKRVFKFQICNTLFNFFCFCLIIIKIFHYYEIL